MSLELYYHPLASFCHKVLIALYESDVEFTARIVNPMDESQRRDFLQLWPFAKIPLLRDVKRERVIPETTIILEYLERYYPGDASLLPLDFDLQLDTRLWDRVFDSYVHAPMQAIVANRLRTETERNTLDVDHARDTLNTAYELIDKQVEENTWVVGDRFSLADCAAAPSLFYAGIVHPFPNGLDNLRAYFERLLERASFHRVLVEAQPYFDMFPFKDEMPQRFLNLGQQNA